MTRGSGTRGSASTAPNVLGQYGSERPYVTPQQPPGRHRDVLLGHVLHAHRELTFVIGVAQPTGALVHAGDALEDLGGQGFSKPASATQA